MTLAGKRIVCAVALSALLLALVLGLPLESRRAGGQWVPIWWGANVVCPLNWMINHGVPWGVVVVLNWATILIWCGGVGAAAAWLIVRPKPMARRSQRDDGATHLGTP